MLHSLADNSLKQVIPEEDLHFYQRKGAKRKRRLPGFIAKNDLKVLNLVKRKAYRLDLQLSMCGFRFGWAGIIGLIPWIGDVIAALLALQLVWKAETIEGGLPDNLRSKMIANVVFDFVIGLIPIVGDLVNIAYKCNSRNFVMLEKYLVEKYHQAAVLESGVRSIPTNDDASNARGHNLANNPTTGVYGDPEKAV
ncbi:hypothetical protein JCM33374_g3781 [Metschnikowia sp. JCM 33374]|nr:hypothetical protein JCM33374_g3781 [Metschnikowia sp. JCM 33374]